MVVGPGLRVGYWNPRASQFKNNAFDPIGYYVGPFLGDHIVGTVLAQKLMEGEVRFRVGVLFRPDLGKRQRLETILMIENYVEEMWDYEDWDRGEKKKDAEHE